MIISVTGKPCSGKDTVSKIFCEDYGFEYVTMGKFFRQVAKQMGYDELSQFQSPEQTREIDNAVDSSLVDMGKSRINDNILVVSRTAWHFIPNSFKVFIDVDWNTAGNRLLTADRDTEKVENLTQAIKNLKNRYSLENKRYKTLYNIDVTKAKFDLVIDSSNLTPEQMSKQIYKEYTKFIKSHK